MTTAPILITNAKIITPIHTHERGWLLCRDGKIAAIAPYNPPNFDNVTIINADGKTLLAGFIDVHTHGSNGYDTMDGDPKSLEHFAQHHAKHGVTSFLATTWSDNTENTNQALAAIHDALGAQENGATILGAHLEGPYLNPEKCGAQNSDFIRRANPKEALQFLDYDVIRLLALAPEFKENHWLITESVKRGITVSVAHSAAKYDDIRFAVTLGLSHATHSFNAMTNLHHREPGVVGAVLNLDELSCELIADNVHVHPAAMNILWRCKGADKVMLISDSAKIAGLADGDYEFSHQHVELKDGVIRLKGNGSLAGSSLTLDRALHNFMQATGEPIEKVWQTASLNPARAINVSDRKGSITIGKDADLTLVDEDINIFMTIVEGRIVYQREDN